MDATLPDDLLTRLLKEVSRSFYLTLRVLPGKVRKPISVAYLLARTSDTIADTEALPCEERLKTLRHFRNCVQNTDIESLTWSDYDDSSTPSAEVELLQRVPEILRLLRALSNEDRLRVQTVLDIIISGQELDLQRFPRHPNSRVIALESESDLEDYLYRVAGCVGQFWTETCGAHLYVNTPGWDTEAMVERGILFGKGLQLVNILRDFAEDLRLGRCYLPVQSWSKAGFDPSDLAHDPTRFPWRSVYDGYLDKAQTYLRQGWDYTLLLPANERRVRLACSWPLLIGARTLGKLRQTPSLLTEEKVKISRNEVYEILLKSVLLHWNKPKWAKLFEQASCR